MIYSRPPPTIDALGTLPTYSFDNLQYMVHCRGLYWCKIQAKWPTPFQGRSETPSPPLSFLLMQSQLSAY